MSKLLIFLGTLLNLNIVQAGTVGVHYYIQNHTNQQVIVQFNNLDQVKVEANQEHYTEVAKAKLSANVFNSMRYQAKHSVTSGAGEPLCETMLDIGTYWNAGPRIAEMNVTYKSGDDENCSVDYGETYETKDDGSQTTRVSYQIFYDIY